jgi:hypothetical protein
MSLAPKQHWSHCFKKFKNHIHEFQQYYEKIWILTMMYPIYAQNINVKYFVF